MRQSRTTMLAALLPPQVAVAEQFGEHAGTLWKEEQEALGRAGPKRHAEFAAGRSCARQALRLLGVPEHAILRGSQREPLWPRGVVGSITHCEGYCAAAVAFANQIAGLGIDAELNQPLPDGVLPMVARQEEMEQLLARGAGAGHHLDRLLFSAKESTYKAWYPITGRWLDFDAVRIDLHPGEDDFEVALVGAACSTARPLRFHGRYAVGGGLIVTCVTAHKN